MTRTSLHWAVPIGVLFLAAACGSSGNKSAGSDGSSSSVGGAAGVQGGSYANTGSVGAGNNSLSGSGNNGGQGNNNAGSANAGSGNDGSAGDSANAGSGAVSTNGGNGSAGDNANGGAGNASTNPEDATGGSGSVDVATGGGTSIDVGTGGGSSIDVGAGGGASLDGATGGSSSLDVPTGGGSSVDVPTGGGSSVDVPTGGGTSIDVGTGGAPSLDLGCQKTTLTDINVYVIKDATPSGADTEGNMYVGGNLTPTVAGYSIGAKDSVDCTTYSLVVGGNASNVVVRGGKAVVGGTATSATDNDCNGISRNLAAANIDFATLEAQVETLSLKLSALTSNCTVSHSSSALVLTGTDTTLNVCNISASDLSGVTETDVNFPAGSSVVVNVSGTTVSWGNGSVCLVNGSNKSCADSPTADYVLWNFYQATSISSSGMAIEGSVLAPLATLDGSGGHIAGQVIVKYLKGGLEYHPYYFNGCLKLPS